MKKITFVVRAHSDSQLPCQADHKVNISWIFVLIRKLRSSHYPAPHHPWFRYYWLKTCCFWSTPDAHQSEVSHAHHCRPSYEPSPLIHVIHMIASYTLYTWYMWYMWYTLSTCYTWFTWHDTRDTHDTYDLQETHYPHVTRAHVLQPHCWEWLSPSAEWRGVDWTVIIISDQPLCSEPHTGRGHQPKLSYICRASLSSLLSPVSYEVARCNSPRYSEIGCPTTLITIILTIERQLCLWSLMKSFIVLDRDNQTFIHCADRNVIKRNEYNYQSYFYLIGLFRVIFFHKKGEDLLVKLLLPGAAGVGEELFASYTRWWNTVTWFVVTDG